MTDNLTNLSTFSQLTTAGMADWLQVAMESFFDRQLGPLSFAPFETYLPTTGSAAEAIWTGLQSMPARTTQHFRRALETVPSRTGPEPQAWRFVAELVLRVDAADAINAIERRLTDPFITDLVRKDGNVLNDMVRSFRNVSPAHRRRRKPLARLLTRLATSGHVGDSQARVILLRLCEVDPDGWTRHVSVLRDLLHRQFSRIRTRKGFSSMLDVQDALALDIVGVVGAERVTGGLTRLRILKDAPGVVPSDNWMWRALLEREQCLLPDDGGVVAWAASPHDRRVVKDRLLELLATPAFDAVPTSRALSVNEGFVSESWLVSPLPTTKVDWALGSNVIQMPKDDDERLTEDA